MPRDVEQTSITQEKRSIKSLTGSRIWPGVNITPTPMGSTATSVPCTTEIRPLSPFAMPNAASERVRPSLVYCSPKLSNEKVSSNLDTENYIICS